jgi:uncharacterized protein YegP (UPF0339 family)
MKRTICVEQRENRAGEFWYVVRAGNGENVLTSKMYVERWRAKRAARHFIKSIAPAPVVFKYWSGPTTPRGRGEVRHHIERVR